MEMKTVISTAKFMWAAQKEILNAIYIRNFQTFNETMSWSIGVLKNPVPISRTSPEVERAAAESTLMTKYWIKGGTLTLKFPKYIKLFGSDKEPKKC